MWRQTGRLSGTVAAIAVMVMMEWQFFVFGVVCFVVVVVGIVQLHIIHNADIFLLASEVVYKMMEKCTHFEEGLQSTIGWRTGCQNLESKENGYKFLHFRGKGSGLRGYFMFSCVGFADSLPSTHFFTSTSDENKHNTTFSSQGVASYFFVVHEPICL